MLLIFRRAHLRPRFYKFGFELLDPVAQFFGRLLNRDFIWRRCRNGFWCWRGGNWRFCDPPLRLRWGGILRRCRSDFRSWFGRGDILLSAGFVLHTQNTFAHFASAIFHNGRLPVWVRLAQLLEKCSGKAVLGQSGAELAFVLEL